MTETEINDAAVLAALGRLSAQLADMTPAMPDIGEYQVKSTRDRFAEGVALNDSGALFAAPVRDLLDDIRTARARGLHRPRFEQKKAS